MRAVAFFVLLSGIAIHSVGFARDDEKDNELIQGAWKVESSKDEGDDVPSSGLVLFLKDGKLTAKDGEEMKGTGTYKVDASKTPKWIDITLGDKSFLGIYELKGDTLTICHGKPGGKRSTKFVSEAGSPNRVLTVLHREKK